VAWIAFESRSHGYFNATVGRVGSAAVLPLIWLVWYERIDPVVRIPARFPVIVELPTRILAGAALERRPVPLWATRTRSSIRLMAMVGAIAAMPSFVFPPICFRSRSR
jgi:hypothetical protein